ncbi:TPA: hypothetical protein DF272_04735 [Candidatus Falkowbacteria bacterium]|nr:hypothetical protein [Candidatus Falkowbacteria bacterium]
MKLNRDKKYKIAEFSDFFMATNFLQMLLTTHKIYSSFQNHPHVPTNDLNCDEYDIYCNLHLYTIFSTQIFLGFDNLNKFIYNQDKNITLK